MRWTLTQAQPNQIRPLNPTKEELETLCRFGKAFADSANAGEFEEKPFLTFIDNMIKSKKGQVYNQINESLDWFKKFKKFL